MPETSTTSDLIVFHDIHAGQPAAPQQLPLQAASDAIIRALGVPASIVSGDFANATSNEARTLDRGFSTQQQQLVAYLNHMNNNRTQPYVLDNGQLIPQEESESYTESLRNARAVLEELQNTQLADESEHRVRQAQEAGAPWAAPAAYVARPPVQPWDRDRPPARPESQPLPDHFLEEMNNFLVQPVSESDRLWQDLRGGREIYEGWVQSVDIDRATNHMRVVITTIKYQLVYSSALATIELTGGSASTTRRFDLAKMKAFPNTLQILHAIITAASHFQVRGNTRRDRPTDPSEILVLPSRSAELDQVRRVLPAIAE